MRGCKFSDPENEVDLVLSRAGKKISMILQIAPLKDQISVLGGVVVPIIEVWCQKKCPAMVKVGLSRFQSQQGNWQACITDSAQDIWKIRTIGFGK